MSLNYLHIVNNNLEQLYLNVLEFRANSLLQAGRLISERKFPNYINLLKLDIKRLNMHFYEQKLLPFVILGFSLTIRG